MFDVDKVQPGLSNSQVKLLQFSLNRVIKSRLKLDGVFGKRTQKAYTKWQRRCGIPRRNSDGYPRLASLNLLSEKMSFDS